MQGASLSYQANSARPVWLDGAAAAAAQQAQPPPVTAAQSKRQKRSMDSSPFAGLMSKKPFRRRVFEAIEEDPEEIADRQPDVQRQDVNLNDDSITTHNLVSRLPSIPTVVTTNTFMQASYLGYMTVYTCNAIST